MRHQIVCFSLTQPFLHCALYAYESCTELIFGQLANTTYATVTQVIDVIDFAATIAQLNENLDDSQNVFVGERHHAGQLITTHTTIELHATHCRQVVTIFAVEQAVEERFD